MAKVTRPVQGVASERLDNEEHHLPEHSTECEGAAATVACCLHRYCSDCCVLEALETHPFKLGNSKGSPQGGSVSQPPLIDKTTSPKGVRALRGLEVNEDRSWVDEDLPAPITELFETLEVPLWTQGPLKLPQSSQLPTSVH